jgi:putative flippase GtrA
MGDEQAIGDGSQRPAHRRWIGFLVSGGLAATVDMLLLEAGVRLLGLSPYAARLVSIALAMVVGWLAHRRLTFAVVRRPSVSEFLAYVTAAATSVSLNYVLFALVLYVKPEVHRLWAFFAATFVSMFFSYFAMRYGVFRRTAK